MHAKAISSIMMRRQRTASVLHAQQDLEQQQQRRRQRLVSRRRRTRCHQSTTAATAVFRRATWWMLRDAGTGSRPVRYDCRRCRLVAIFVATAAATRTVSKWRNHGGADGDVCCRFWCSHLVHNKHLLMPAAQEHQSIESDQCGSV